MENLTIVLHSTLTVPSIMGGAVETLLNNFLEENEKKKRFRCTVIAHYVAGIDSYKDKFHYAKFEYIRMPTLCIRFNSVLINKYHLKLIPDLWEKLLINKVIEVGNEKVLVEGGGQMVIKLKKRCPQLKIYYHLHADMKEYRDDQELCVMNSIEKIIGVSRYISDKQISYGILPEKSTFVLNGLNLRDFCIENIKESREEICTQFGLDVNKKYILFKGRIVKEKGILELIEAFSKIKRGDISLLIAGSVNFAEKRLIKNKFEQLVRKKIDKDQRIKLLGYVNYKDMPKLQKISELAVVPSIWQEPCGLVVIENIISGLPLIATKTGGIPEVINGTQAIALNVDEEFIEKLASEIENILVDDERRLRMSESEYKNRIYLSTERYYDDLCNVLEER